MILMMDLFWIYVLKIDMCANTGNDIVDFGVVIFEPKSTDGLSDWSWCTLVFLGYRYRVTHHGLKEYYEIGGESRPLSAFFPTHCGFFYRKAFLLMKLSDVSPNCFTIDVWNINCWCQQFISYLSYWFFLIAFYSILHEFCSVLRCDILGIGLF